jgi:hypothetical protein
MRTTMKGTGKPVPFFHAGGWHVRLFVILLTLMSPTVAVADSDVMRRLTGTFGMPDTPDFTCAANPITITFSADGLVMTSTMAQAIIDYEGRLRISGDYVVRGADAGGLALALEGESRLTDAGDPVVWVLRPTPDGFCWGRTDWADTECASYHVRCAGAAPVS